YYISNARPRLTYGRGAEDHRHAYKFSVTYELPFLKSEKGIIGHALGGWSLGSFLQFYSGHPVDVFDGRTRFRARDANCTRPCASEGGAIDPSGCLIRDPNGIPFNLGGDYDLDNVLNDHPIFIGGNINNVYSGNSPADGIFKDNNVIGC